VYIHKHYFLRGHTKPQRVRQAHHGSTDAGYRLRRPEATWLNADQKAAAKCTRVLRVLFYTPATSECNPGLLRSLIQQRRVIKALPKNVPR
jgi:hypothetical protein